LEPEQVLSAGDDPGRRGRRCGTHECVLSRAWLFGNGDFSPAFRAGPARPAGRKRRGQLLLEQREATAEHVVETHQRGEQPGVDVGESAIEKPVIRAADLLQLRVARIGQPYEPCTPVVGVGFAADPPGALEPIQYRPDAGAVYHEDL